MSVGFRPSRPAPHANMCCGASTGMDAPRRPESASTHKAGNCACSSAMNPAWSRLYRQGENLRELGHLSKGTRVLFEAKGWQRDLDD